MADDYDPAENSRKSYDVAIDAMRDKLASFRCERIHDATLYLGDCREILPLLPKVDAVVTDPPYSSGGYQETGKSSGSIGTDAKDKWGGKRPEIAADNLSTRGYMRLISEICKGSKSREIYLFCDWKMWTYTCDALEDGFFRPRGMIVWNKGVAGMGVGWRGQHELICWGLRGPAKIPANSLGNVLSVSRSGNPDHPTQKPVELLEELMRGTDATTILDPFMGSGTTGVACAKLGRKFIGIELEEKYFNIAVKRIDDAYRQPRLFKDEPPKPKQGALL
jgi:DNA modification methylase